MLKIQFNKVLPLFVLNLLLFNTQALSQSVHSDCYTLKTSLNAYSFHKPLSEGTMDIFDLIDFCVDQNFDAVDITGYYFPGYPEVPSDEFIYEVKNYAFKNGLEISGTGIRTDFTLADPGKRQEYIELVRKWTEVAAKLGAPVLRIFAGHDLPEGYTNEEILEWMIPDLQECVRIAEGKGVILGMQNHNGFIKNANQIIEICKTIDSRWFGMVLDIGSYRQGDPYYQITKSIPYAVNWQIKEKMYENGNEVDTDIKRIINIIRKNCYRGYIPIETLGPGNPKEKVQSMKAELDFIL